MSGPIGSSQWMYASGEAVTQQSLKFNDDESQYLSWTPAAAGNRKTWTFSFWMKRGNISTQGLLAVGTADGSEDVFYLSGNRLRYRFSSGSDNTPEVLLRDSSAWYHIVLAVDTTQATAKNRLKWYLNGDYLDLDVVGYFSDHNNFPSLNHEFRVNNNQLHYLGEFPRTSQHFDGYLSDIHFIDGQALDASSFGETVDGYWKAKDYAGTYGTNGFRLTFQDDVVSEGFNAVTWRGTNTQQSLSGLGFSPDLVWTKYRSQTGSHQIHDTIRGATSRLFPDLTNAESSTNGIVSFDADGFTIGDNSTSHNMNAAGTSAVAWCWDAGSGSAASNTDGSITSTVKANPDYGFSVVSYVGNGVTGATVGHSLGVKPDMFIVKNRTSSGVNDWSVYHSSLTATHRAYLHKTDAAGSTSAWNNTEPTSSVFTLKNFSELNSSGDNYIAYCFAEVAGYSSIGSYSGTGATGNVVTTGFRPAFLLYKRTDAGGNDWVIMDTTRSPANPVEKRLFPNLSDAESAGAGGGIDVTDTGFVINNTYANANASGGTYLFYAVADTREAAFWKDVSGQGNHWTPNNLDYRDSLPDSPANNFATLNPLHRNSVVVNSYASLKEGNLNAFNTTDNVEAAGTLGVSSGKWYYEGRKVQSDDTSEGFGFHTNGQEAIYRGGAFFRFNGSQSSYGSTWDDGDVIGVALDLDNTSITFYKNGVSQGVAKSDLPAGTYLPFLYNRGANCSMTANFGQDSTFAGATTAGGNQDDNGIGDFKYAPPSGYLALCTANLPTPTIVDGSEYFNTVLWTGNGSTQSITGVGFQPDFIWSKERSSTSGHTLLDTVRGVNLGLESSSTGAELDYPTDAQTSFDADGFSVGSNGRINQSSQTYAAWNWKAGGTAVSNTDGSITSQVSANTDAGFSVVSYTGNTTTNTNFTVGHGLGQIPSMVIIKNRDWASGVKAWEVWHKDIGNNLLALDSTSSVSSGDYTYIMGAAPTSTTFSVRQDTAVTTANRYRANGPYDYIAYCFANTDGYLKAGSYTGNGSNDGPFVYTGFRPAFLLVKRTNSTGNWFLVDATRNGYNLVNSRVQANTTATEADDSNNNFDFLSNGFKLRAGAGTDTALSGSTYIYLAFAETPFKYANAR